MKSASQMKSKLRLDEIKSALSPAVGGFYHKVISPTKGGFIPSARTDLVEKLRRQKSTEFFWSYWPDLNRRPADYESAALPTEPQ